MFYKILSIHHKFLSNILHLSKHLSFFKSLLFFYKRTTKLSHTYYVYHLYTCNGELVLCIYMFFSVFGKNDIVIFLVDLTTGNPVYYISTKSSRWVRPVSRRFLLLHGTWSYLRFIGGPCCPTLDFVYFFFFFLDYDYVWHNVNFLYTNQYCSSGIIYFRN